MGTVRRVPRYRYIPEDSTADSLAVNVLRGMTFRRAQLFGFASPIVSNISLKFGVTLTGVPLILDVKVRVKNGAFVGHPVSS